MKILCFSTLPVIPKSHPILTTRGSEGGNRVSPAASVRFLLRLIRSGERLSPVSHPATPKGVACEDCYVFNNFHRFLPSVSPLRHKLLQRFPVSLRITGVSHPPPPPCRPAKNARGCFPVTISRSVGFGGRRARHFLRFSSNKLSPDFLESVLDCCDRKLTI